MKIAVIDGQGGGIGKSLVETLKKEAGKSVEIYAFGTNALATSLMIKAGADYGATGENAIRVNMAKMNVIMGPIGIISANALMGELTPVMAEAVSSSSALKILIPVHKCQIIIAGLEPKPFAAYIDSAVKEALKWMDEQ